MSTKVTHLLYIVDLKIFAASATKLERVMGMVKAEMECVGFIDGARKSAPLRMLRGTLDLDAGSMKIDDLKPISSLKENSHLQTPRSVGNQQASR